MSLGPAEIPVVPGAGVLIVGRAARVATPPPAAPRPDRRPRPARSTWRGDRTAGSA